MPDAHTEELDRVGLGSIEPGSVLARFLVRDGQRYIRILCGAKQADFPISTDALEQFLSDVARATGR